MTGDAAGAFRLTLPSVAAPFSYRVVAGAVTSPTYEVAVAIPPRVTRIDVHYTYPAGLRLAPRTETDGGDIYAPAGTDGPRPGVHRPAGRDRSDDAGRRQTDRARCRTRQPSCPRR